MFLVSGCVSMNIKEVKKTRDYYYKQYKAYDDYYKALETLENVKKLSTDMNKLFDKIKEKQK